MKVQVRNSYSCDLLFLNLLRSLKYEEPTVASVVEQNIDIICVQGHRFYHEEPELKYLRISNRLIFDSVSAGKNSVNAAITSVGMYISALE